MSVMAAVSLAPLACGDATDIELLEIGGSGVVFGQAFLDLDGDGELGVGGGDLPLAGVDVVLVTGASSEVVQLATTDSVGAFTLFEVPVGTYRLALDSAAVGDSLEVLGDNELISIALGDTSLINLGVTYPTRTIEEITLESVGRKVFTSGIAQNARLNFDRSGQVHFRGDTGFLRALNVDRGGVLEGDSVRLLGRVITDNGRPALDEVTPTVLILAAAIVTPRETTAAEAAAAGGGALDAALVRARNLAITDTSTSLDGHFRFWAVDGADSVEVVVRDFVAINTSALRPDTTLELSEAIGLLNPVDNGAGTVRWQILPRQASDLVLQTKQADIGVTVALDTVAASLGDTIEATVVVSNAGPRAATAFEVRDTVPTALTYLSSTQTGGSYDSGTGLWSIAGLDVGQADTLRVLLEVTDGTPASIPIIVESLGLTFEVDPNPTNNGATVLLGVS
jgi:uncharacterized repeat protein (TIGR01451 family)